MSNQYETITAREAGRKIWNAFADACPEAWLQHRYELLQALATWPRRVDLSFAVRDTRDGSLAAIVPLFLLKSRRHPALQLSVLDSLGGPAVHAEAGKKARKAILDQVFRNLDALAHAHGAGEIALSLSAMAPALRAENCPLVNPLVHFGYENALTQTWVADLRGGEDAIWQRMEGRARTAVRKAEKEDVTVRPAQGAADLDSYYDLHCRTYERTGAAPHPKAYFEVIWNEFLPAGLCRIFMAEHQGRVVSAENFGVYKDAALYWTGATSDQGLALNAPSLVMWTAMQWMAARGVAWFETGEAFPGETGKLKGLNDFKKSFGGELFPSYKGRRECAGRLQRTVRFIKGMIHE